VDELFTHVLALGNGKRSCWMTSSSQTKCSGTGSTSSILRSMRMTACAMWARTLGSSLRWRQRQLENPAECLRSNHRQKATRSFFAILLTTSAETVNPHGLRLGCRRELAISTATPKRGNNSFLSKPWLRKVGEEKAETNTLDNVCKSEHIERLDFLKVDTEGYEAGVLMGAMLALNRLHPKVALQTHSYGGPRSQIVDLLEGVGYKTQLQRHDRMTKQRCSMHIRRKVNKSALRPNVRI
jgi:FkbM family methyltransferase